MMCIANCKILGQVCRVVPIARRDQTRKGSPRKIQETLSRSAGLGEFDSGRGHDRAVFVPFGGTLWTGDVVETSKIETRLGGHGLTKRNPARNQC